MVACFLSGKASADATASFWAFYLKDDVGSRLTPEQKYSIMSRGNSLGGAESPALLRVFEEGTLSVMEEEIFKKCSEGGELQGLVDGWMCIRDQYVCSLSLLMTPTLLVLMHELTITTITNNILLLPPSLRLSALVCCMTMIEWV